MKTQIWLHIIDMVDEYVLIVFIDGRFIRTNLKKNILTRAMYEDIHNVQHDNEDCISATIEAVEAVLDANNAEYCSVSVEIGAKSNKIYIWNE